MGSTDKNFSSTGYEPKDYLLTETYVEFNQESVTEQRFPEQRFSEVVDYDAAIGEMLFNAYRMACFLVSRRRRQCLKIERCDPLLKQVTKF